MSLKGQLHAYSCKCEQGLESVDSFIVNTWMSVVIIRGASVEPRRLENGGRAIKVVG
jgi:hypothetical protein